MGCSGGMQSNNIVHWFNPGYEASLDKKIIHYTPTRQVSQFRRDCAPLPLYLSKEGERVLVSSEVDVCHHPAFITELTSVEQIIPWGWAPEVLAKSQSVTCGVDEMCYWGSRERSVELWGRVKEKMQLLMPKKHLDPSLVPPILVNADKEVITKQGAYVTKKLFSSSGRGVLFHTVTESHPLCLSRGVILEEKLDIVEDFALEFSRDQEGRITYLGVSLFSTRSGKYLGNRLHSDFIFPPPSLDLYIQAVGNALEEFPLGAYTGLFGVDTALYRKSDGGLAIAPLIELNLRPTMGHLALALEERLPRSAAFEIHYKDFPRLNGLTPLYSYSEEEVKSLPAGHYLLTPLFESTRFIATVTIE